MDENTLCLEECMYERTTFTSLSLLYRAISSSGESIVGPFRQGVCIAFSFENLYEACRELRDRPNGLCSENPQDQSGRHITHEMFEMTTFLNNCALQYVEGVNACLLIAVIF